MRLILGDAEVAVATFDEQFFVHQPGRLPRGRRDLRLFRFLATIAWRWFWQGGAVRRSYRRAEATGQIYYLDAHKGVGKYGR